MIGISLRAASPRVRSKSKGGSMMRSRRSLLLLVALTMLGAITMPNPAVATSAYHMNGQGEITVNSPGFPACLPFLGFPDCANVATTFTWGNLTVQGLGVLDETPVAGQYACASEGDGFVSTLSGNTSNFILTFNFQCTKTAGEGPNAIDGFFSNDAADGRLSGHPYLVQGFLTGGVPAFLGYFVQGASHVNPLSIGSGEPMSCTGGFAPTQITGTRINKVFFVGECTAIG